MGTANVATASEARAETVPDVPRFVFEDVTWDDYEAMLRLVGDRHIFVTYDQGSMEVISPISFYHASQGYSLARFVDVITEEMDIPMQYTGMTTFRREDLRKGGEADYGFYFRENSEHVRGKKSLDMNIDPPPDLVIEVDITSSSLKRLGIFAALGTPEAWRYDGADLQFLHLQADGTYQPRESSLAFPFFTVAEAARILEESGPMDKTAWIRSFRAYVRDVLIPRAR